MPLVLLNDSDKAEDVIIYLQKILQHNIDHYMPINIKMKNEINRLRKQIK